MKKGGLKKKFGMVLDTEEINAPNPMEQSVYSQIEPDGLRFLKDDIKISSQGITKTSGDIGSILSINKDDIEFGKTLGRGASGSVQEGLYIPLKAKVAIKSVVIFDKDKRHQLMNDLKLLIQNKMKAEKDGNIYCPFLVNLYGGYFDEGSVKIILELMDCGSLCDIIKKAKLARKDHPLIDEPVLARIAQQILNGLMYLHIVGHQIHRDIKPANVLINSKGEVKLTDFGISKELDMTNQLASTQLGTISYMSPERLQGKKYNHNSDIWSFGLIMIELATGNYPYPTDKSRVIVDMLDVTGQYPAPSLPDDDNFSKEFKSFIGRCMEKDPKKRASAVELLSHSWILKNLYKHVDLAGWIRDLKDKSEKREMHIIDEKE